MPPWKGGGAEGSWPLSSSLSPWCLAVDTRGRGGGKVASQEGTLCNRTGSYRCYLEGYGEEAGLGGWLEAGWVFVSV